MNSEQKRLIRVETSVAKTTAHFGTKVLGLKQFELQFYVSDILYYCGCTIDIKILSIQIIWPHMATGKCEES